MIWLLWSGFWAGMVAFRVYHHLPMTTVDVALSSATIALYFGVWAGKQIERIKRP